jgi:hypothetical protein
MCISLTISLTILILLILTWIQRKTINELERDIWEIETAYKRDTGKIYRWKRGNKEEGSNR